jgi:hypothetical protein
VELRLSLGRPEAEALAESWEILEALLFDLEHGGADARRILLEAYGHLSSTPPRGAHLSAAREVLLEAARSGRLVARRIPVRRVIMPVQTTDAALGPDTGPPPPDDWIAIQLLNQDGDPVPRRGYRIVTPDNAVYDGQLDDKGYVKIDGIPSGTCKVTCPYIEPHGEITHVVQPGEHASGIAAKYGFEDVATVWGHGNNADVRNKRDKSHVLAPGDEVFVPEAPSDYVTKPTGAKHVFNIQQSPLKLRVKLLDPKTQPVASTPVKLDGKPVTTDGDGIAELPIDKLATGSSLTVDGTDYPLQIGGLNPMDDDSEAGWQGRLFNMGFLAYDDTDEDDTEMKFAISDFQAENGMPVTGALDDSTKSKIKEVHGS